MFRAQLFCSLEKKKIHKPCKPLEEMLVGGIV